MADICSTTRNSSPQYRPWLTLGAMLTAAVGGDDGRQREGRMMTREDWYSKMRARRGESMPCPNCGSPAEITYIARPLVPLDCPAVDCPLCDLVPLHPPADLDEQGRIRSGTYAGMTPDEVLAARDRYNRLCGE